MSSGTRSTTVKRKLQSALEVLTAAYLRMLNDAKTAAHIAWLHNWRIAERVGVDSHRPPSRTTRSWRGGTSRRR